MLTNINNNIMLEKKLLFNQEYDKKNNIDLKNILSKSVFNNLKKILLNQEIEFDNISTKEKKERNENIVSFNFFIINLIKILYQKDIQSKYIVKKNYQIFSKNKLQKSIQSKLLFFIKNQQKKPCDIFKKKGEKYISFFCNKKKINTYNELNQYHNSKNINIFNYFFNKYFLTKLNRFAFLKNNNFFSHNNLIFLKDYKNNNKSHFYFSKYLNIIKNKTQNINFFNNKANYIDTSVKNFFLSNINKNYLNKYETWKKIVSQKVLLAISKKENHAEIYLKPKSLGKIYIKIKMKNNDVILKFFSNHNEIKIFLNNCVPFLRDSLMNSGIQLHKAYFHDFLCEKKINFKKNKNTIKDSFFDEFSYKKIFYLNKISEDTEKYKCIDIYV